MLRRLPRQSKATALRSRIIITFTLETLVVEDRGLETLQRWPFATVRGEENGMWVGWKEKHML